MFTTWPARASLSVPYIPVSHPFIERLIGTIRREYLDRVFFWNAVDLTRKLEPFRDYYNASRVHRSLQGKRQRTAPTLHSLLQLHLISTLGKQFCRVLFQAQIAA